MILQSNPVKQIILWMTTMVEQVVANWSTVATVLAAGVGLYLLLVLWRRLQSSSDPSMRMQSSSAAGTTSVLLSGTHVSMLLAGVIGVLTWPAAIEEPAIGLLLVLAVVLHYYLEKREAEMN